MFKALMGGGRSASTSDARSTTSSSSKTTRRKTDSKSASSRKSSRGDDRDRGLGDLSAYPPSTSGSRRGPPSIAGESVASTYVTAEPDVIDYPDRTIVERTPKRKDSDRESKSSRRRERDRSESRERERRRVSRRSGDDDYEDDRDTERDRDRRDRSRTHSGDHYVPPISTAIPSSAPGAQFATDIAAPGFSQFPMQFDSAMHPPVTTAPAYSPGHDTSTAAYDPHVQQQFPGQFPSGTAQPYFPPNNPAGAAADYYGDQGQSVNDQPGVRPQQPAIIPNSQAHLMAASPTANPPPEPSSLGQVGAAAAYFTDDAPHTEPQVKPPKPGMPGKPSKPSKPSKPPSSSSIPAAAAAATAVTYGVGNYEESQAAAAYQHESHSSTTYQQTHSYSQAVLTSTSKPPHAHGIGSGVGLAAAGAAAGYMMGHQHHGSSPTHSSQYTFQNYEQSSQASVPPYGGGPDNTILAAGTVTAVGAAGYAPHATHNPGFYPHGGLAVQHRHRGPLTKFVDFWRDPEGVGRFEDYTETIGVCKYCFEPGTSSLNAPRKHHYHARRHSADRRSSGSSSRVDKLNRYHSSEDERRSRKHSSKKTSSWLPGMLTGYAAKSLFTGKDFDESYSIRSGHVSDERVSTYDREGDRRSYTSRGVVRRSGRSPPREYHSDSKHTRRTRSRSRSSSRSDHHSFVKEAALGAAVGGAALAVAKSGRRARSRSPSRVQHRKDSSSSASFVDVSRSSAKSVGGFTSFFTASSENRKKEKAKKQRSKKSRGFFSFNGSSSSSLDADLAFGSGFAKKPSKLQKKKKGKKNENIDAALLGLGATATALAASSHMRNSRTTGQIMTTRDAHQGHYTSSATNEDDEWVDAESDDQSSSSVSTTLAFGASTESGSDSNSSGGWKWGWGNKKKKKDKKPSKMDAALAAGAGAVGGAAIASVARRRDSRPPSEAGSLQQVYPVPTSDPSRFDVAKMSPSVASGGQPPLVRSGPIPLQHPQPYTPVSQAVYATQGPLPGGIPAYSPGAVPPIFANEYDHYIAQLKDSRDASYNREDASFVDRRKHQRSESSPVFPTQETSTSNPKRRSTIRDQASVSFDLTEEQAERERRLDRRDRKSWDDIRDHPVQLYDHEADLAREEAERRERRERRKYHEEENRRSDNDKEKDSAPWAEATAIGAIGAIGAVAASSLISSDKKYDEDVSEVSSRRRDRRAERRAERRGDSSVISKSSVAEPIEEKVSSVSREERDNTSPRRSPRPTPVYEDYAEFFAPEEVRHSPDQSSRDQERKSESGEPQIIEVVPASEREKNNDEPRDDLPQFAKEPYEDRNHLPWPVPRLNFIEPTPPGSVNGSVRGTSSPITSVEPVIEEVEPKEREHEREPETVQTRERTSTGSRVSWGPHQTHEYEIPSSSEYDPHSPIEEITRDLSMKESETEEPKDIRDKTDFGNDIEFAAIAAASAQAAGFDPSVIINDPTYHTRTSPPGSGDEGTFSYRSKWATPPQTEHPDGFVEGEINSSVPSKSRDVQSSVEHVIEPLYAEPEALTKDTDQSSAQQRDRGSIAQEVIEQLNGRSPRNSSPDNDVFSMPGGFDNVDVPRDDTRSVFSAPPERESVKSKSKKSRHSGDDVEFPREISSRERELSSPSEGIEGKTEEKTSRRKHRFKDGDIDSFTVDEDVRSAITSVEDVEKSERRKHRHRSSRDTDFDDAASVASSPAAASYEDGEKSERRKRRSKRESDTFSLDDDARSAITSIDDGDKSERRKHRRRSSRDKDFDDNASISSSPGRIDETHEKRRSKDGKDEKEKDKSGSILRSIFGSRVSAPEGRTRSNQSSRSSSLEKRPSRDAVSEAGVDEERRHRKKRSSRHSSSSGGDKLDDKASDKEGSVRDDASLEEYRSQRQQKEERRRHRYEEIVESGKRRESEKDEKHSDHKDDGDTDSFLAERPEMPPAAERDERGASGLESWVEGTLATATGIDLGEGILHQRVRSRSTSHPRAERAADLAPRSQSRPSSPQVARDLDQPPHHRRASMARSTTESPTAVPIHFRRPPTSPGLSRAVPVPTSSTASCDSPTSPSQTRHRRPNSLEFRNSREIRPLWLVERHGSSKGDLIEPDEVLPSLPSSKTSSRAPSVEDLRALRDEDAVRSWEPFDLSPSMMERGRLTGLTISTSRASDQDDGDLLDSQQATPTADNFGASTGTKKQKPTYEFHSPSELLQDPAMYPDMPASTLEALPSAEGSVVGATGTDAFETPTEEREVLLDRSETATSAGFANIVDAAVIAAAKEHGKSIAPENDDTTVLAIDKEVPVEANLGLSAAPAPKIGDFADIVNAAVAAEVAHDKALPEEDIGEPGTAIEEHAPKDLEIEHSVVPEATKELGPESVDTPAQPVESQRAEERVAEEVTTTSPSKKKKKKKGKKGQTSVDLPAEPQAISEEETSAEVVAENTPAAEVPKAESRSIGVEGVSIPGEKDVAVEPQTEVEAVEASRELETESLPVVAVEVAEAERTIQPKSEPQPAIGPEAVVPAESDAALASESQPETPGDTTEPEASMTAAQKRKAKKAAKKKAKSLSVSESVEAPTEDTAIPQPSDEIPAAQTDMAPQVEPDVATAVEPESQDAFQDVNTADASLSVEPTNPDAQESRDIVEPVEPISVEEQPQLSDKMTIPVDQSPAEPVLEPETSEIQPSENAQAEITAEPEQIVEIAQPQETVEPAAAIEDAALHEKPNQSDDDLFHEAVSEQPDVSEGQKEVQPGPATEPVTETAAAESEPELEVPLTAAQRKKAKKDKKKRKSVAFEDNTAPSPPAVDSQVEEVSKEVQPEQPTPVDAVDDQQALTSCAKQPSEVEQATMDKPEPPVEDSKELPEPAAEGTMDVTEPSSDDSISVPQSESALSLDGEPTQAVDTAEAAETSGDQAAQSAAQAEAAADAEAEPEVPMTAAQKKKAKKDKKKKAKQQSVSSVPEEEKPVEAEVAEAQPADKTENILEVLENAEPIADAPELASSSELVAAVESVETSEPVPSAPADELDHPKETVHLPSEKLPSDSHAPEGRGDEPVEADQSKEDVPTSAPEVEAVPEASIEPSDVAKPQEEPTVSEDKTEPEALLAEPEVPMSAAEKKKAKKAKKKKQKQESIGSVSEETPSAETVSAPDTEVTKVSEEVQPVPETESKEVDEAVASNVQPETVETSKEVDAREPSAVEPETVPQSEIPAEAEVVEPFADTPSASIEGVISTEALQEIVLPEPEQAKEEESAQPPVTQVLPTTEDVDTQPVGPETPTTDAEVPLTAAQKKKAKKDKKKKRQSAQLDEQTNPEAEAAPTEQREIEQTAPGVSVPEETKAVDGSGPAEADNEIHAEATLIAEDSQAPAEADKDAPMGTSANELTAPEATIEPSADAPAVPEVSVLPSTLQETIVIQPADQDREFKDAIPTSEEPAADNCVTHENIPEKPAEVPNTTAETTGDSVPVEESTAPTPEAAANEQAEEAESTTPLSKKDKKKKKKNKSLVPEEESQPELQLEGLTKPAEVAEPTEVVAPTQPVEPTHFIESAQPVEPIEPVEPTQTDEPIEPPTSENVDSTKAVDEHQSVTVTDEPRCVEPPSLEEPLKDEAIPEQPSTEVTEETSQLDEPEVPLTAAQKRKLKKDKKKRKSVAFEDEATAAQTKTQHELEHDPVESVELKDIPSDEPAPSQDLSEATKDAEEVARETPTIDQAEPPVAGIEQIEVLEIGKEDTPSDKVTGQGAQEPQTESSTPAQDDKQPLEAVGHEISSDDKTDLTEEPSTQATEATETAAEAGLSAKERRKLKKKEKKKSKSVDLSEETSSPAESSKEAEAPTEFKPDAPEEIEHETPQVDHPEVPTTAITDSQKLEEPEITEGPTESVKDDTQEAVKTAEPETIDTPEPITEQEPAESKALDDKPPVAEAATEADTEEKPDQPGPDAEASMTAKERRKLKKKEKKRQSKNLEADENAPADAATESKDGLQELEQPKPTESDTLELSETVTASSPAENDGKELQSHDTETPTTPVKNLASTDEFLSSQVEQPQVESRSLDYPPPPVLERDFDSGEVGDAQTEEGVATALKRPEVPSAEGEKSLGEAEPIAEKDDQPAMEVEPVQGEVESPEADVPVVTAEEMPQAEEGKLTEREPFAVAAAEEAEQPISSKKQKKKDKKKKQKQEEKEEEELLAPAAERLAAEEKDQPGPAAETNEQTEDQPIVEAITTTEEQSLLVAEEPSTEAVGDVDPGVRLTEISKDVESAEDIEHIEAGNVGHEPENIEETPISRTMSKKEKKKKKKQRQALLVQQADVEVQSEPKEHATLETVQPEITAPVSDAPDASASTEQYEDVKPVETSDTLIQPSDSPYDDSKEIELMDAGEQPIVPELEQAKPANELLSEEPNPGEADLASVPADATAIVPPTDSTGFTKQRSSENDIGADPEPPTIKRKMSKKEKKAAAAAAAAAALAAQKKKPAEQEPAHSEITPAPEETLDVPQEQSALDKTPQTPELEPHVEQEAAEQKCEKFDLATFESVGNVFEKPTIEVEQHIEPSAETSKPDEVVEEPVSEKYVDEAMTRKLSKKKRKAKKQAEQGAGDASPTEAQTPAEVATPEPEVSAATESVSPEEPREIVSEAEPVTGDIITAEEISQPENLPVSINETRREEAKEIEESEAPVSLRVFDAPSAAEEKSVQLPTEHEDQAAIGSFDLAKEADVDTAEDTTPLAEPEMAVPLSKGLSKKERRKVKKNGVMEEEPSTFENEESSPLGSIPAVEAQATSASVPISLEAESLAGPRVHSETTKELQSESEAAKETEIIIEAQSAFELPTSTTNEPEPEPEPETALSRKASKKKAKKAKKANQGLEQDLPADNTTEPQDPGFVPEPEAFSKEIRGPTLEKKQDDEEWPAIEWVDGLSHKHEPPHNKVPEPEPVMPVPVSEDIGEYDESAIPAALQEAKKDQEQPIDEEEEAWSAPLSKKDKKRAKKNKRKSEQAALTKLGEPDEEPSHKKVELAYESMSVETPVPAPKEIESEPPARTTTPGGSKIASLFPGLERGGFRRSALDKKSPSLKDSAEEETAADLEANRDIAIPVSEAPLATTDIYKHLLDSKLPTEGEREAEAAIIEQDTPAVISHSQKESPTDPEFPFSRERSIAEQLPLPDHATLKERSSMLFGSSPSTHTEEATSPRHLLPSQLEAAQDSSCGLRRAPSVIHGRHQHTPRTWNLEDASIPAQAHSPPRSLFGGPYDEPQSRPRTPLQPIAEQEPGDADYTSTGHGETPRLEIKPEHVLPRPQTPVRKFTDNAMARETWPTSENEKARSQDDPHKASKLSGESGSPMTQTPDQGMPVLKPSGSKGKLRRTNRSTSSDLRGASKALDSSQPPPTLDLDQLPSSSSYDPVTDKGKRPLRNMSDVYEGWGETPSSPRSPSRPPSVRRRQSMQHLQDLESRLDQLISENRLLIAARDEAEDKLRNASVARRKSDRALNSSGADLRDKEAEVEQLKSSVEWLQREMARLTEENGGLTASNAALAAAHAEEVNTVRESSTRELEDLRSQHAALSTQVDTRVRQEIESALAQKDAELRRLREELEEARDKVKELQQQIATSLQDNTLVFRDEDYFDAACQKLCGHVQQWVLRFSKHSDHRRCRTLSELHDEKIADRFDNALLDGSDADSYLSDRVRRRDVFMSVVMTMVWEYIFTRYLFGMDREQRQKLKSLEKQLGEVGSRRAVHRWRATTLTLLAKRPAFASQRQSDTEAVALEIFGTLSRVLPPPSQVEVQLLESLRKVLRVAVNLSLEMRTQLAEFIMLPPLQPEYDTNGDLSRQVYFNASLMNERSGETTSNDELEAQQAVVRIVLFPLVVKKGNDVGEGDDEVVVCPAQVLVARPGKDKRVSKMMSGDRMSVDARSVYSAAPSMAPPSVMDMSNVI